MTRGQKLQAKKPEYLSPSELQNLQDEKKELESTVHEIEAGVGVGTAGSGIDVGQIKREISRIDNAIGARMPDKPTGLQKDRLAKEERDLEDRIADGMPTRYEMNHPAKNPGAVRKHLQWSQRNQATIERYVQIQRTLRPLEPKSIEVLRREK